MLASIRHALATCVLLLGATSPAYADSPQLQIRGRVELPGGAAAAGRIC